MQVAGQYENIYRSWICGVANFLNSALNLWVVTATPAAAMVKLPWVMHTILSIKFMAPALPHHQESSGNWPLPALQKAKTVDSTA